MEMTITAKGQFTLNKRLMEHLGIKAGDKVSITKAPEGINISAIKNKISITEALARFDSLRGNEVVKPISIEEMNKH